MMIACFSEHLAGSCAELVLNLEEVGISEWEDRAPRKVIVPLSMADQTIHQGVHRNLKHMLTICCVSAAGESLTPFVVSSQVTDKVIETLKIEEFGWAWTWYWNAGKRHMSLQHFSAVYNKCPDPVH
jgi:hypothetical protein